MRVPGLLILIALNLAPIPAHAFEELRVAAAADIQFALPQIAAAFEQHSGQKVSISFGSSGNLSAQIQSGAPFDVFLSADTDYAKQLVDRGLANADSLYEYAQGKLVLWVLPNSSLDPSKGLGTLLLPQVKRVAIANPEHAPYGRAAMAALEKSGIYSAISSKLVLGESVAQAFQFASSGNADIALLSLSLAEAPTAKGRYWLLPENFYPAIRQSAVVLKNSSHQRMANAFLAFLRTPAAKNVFEKFGLTQEHPQVSSAPAGAKL